MILSVMVMHMKSESERMRIEREEKAADRRIMVKMIGQIAKGYFGVEKNKGKQRRRKRRQLRRMLQRKAGRV